MNGDTRQSTLKIRNDWPRWYDLWLRPKINSLETQFIEQLELQSPYAGKNCQGPVACLPVLPSLGRFRPGEWELTATVHLRSRNGKRIQGRVPVSSGVYGWDQRWRRWRWRWRRWRWRRRRRRRRRWKPPARRNRGSTRGAADCYPRSCLRCR